MLALGAAGCDLSGPNVTTVRGRVTSAETGEPVEGIYLTLKANGGGFLNPDVAEAETDADGRYEIDRESYLSIYFNWESRNENGQVSQAYLNYCFSNATVPDGESNLDVALRPRIECN